MYIPTFEPPSHPSPSHSSLLLSHGDRKEYLKLPQLVQLKYRLYHKLTLQEHSYDILGKGRTMETVRLGFECSGKLSTPFVKQ